MANDYARTCKTCRHGRKARPEELRPLPNGEPNKWKSHHCNLLGETLEPHSSPNSCVMKTPVGCVWEARRTK